jgi:hypothetical protein
MCVVHFIFYFPFLENFEPTLSEDKLSLAAWGFEARF